MGNILKVAFVDDERLIRRLVSNCVDWGELGYEIVGESAGGMDAVEMAVREQPDLIFMDIYMPVMNGLEVTERILEERPDTLVIMLTGHQEFDYAKAAVNLRAFDYLLKPINTDELKEAAERAHKSITNRKKKETLIDNMQQRLKDDFPIMQENYLLQLLEGTYCQQTCLETMEYYGIDIIEGSTYVAVIEVDIIRSIEYKNSSDILMILVEVRNRISKLLDKHHNVHSVNQNNRIILIISDTSLDLSQLISKVKAEFTEYSDYDISAGISNKVNVAKDICTAYNQAELAVNYKLVNGMGNIVEYSRILKDDKDFINNENSLHAINLYIRAGLADDAKKAVNSLFAGLKSGSIHSIEQLQAIGTKILSDCLVLASEMSIDNKYMFGSKKNRIEQIVMAKTLPEIQSLMEEVVYNLSKKVSETQSFNSSSIVKDIQKYIDENITNAELSLKGVAKKFYINPSYLSRTYKEIVGESYIEYVKRKRMELAIKLLAENDYKAYQLSNMVGIDDPHYFSVIFKKHTGITLSDYKKKIKDAKGETR